jgi:hypothetical protein
MYVVVWEPKRGQGGGHQLVTDPVRADSLRCRIGRERPDAEVRIVPAHDFAAAAVVERQERERSRRRR